MSFRRCLEALEGSGAAGETEAERAEKRKKVREQAEHANHCRRSEIPPFVVDEEGKVFSSRDGKPITEPHQTLAEEWYWQELEWHREAAGEGIEVFVHDEEAQAFYTPDGELTLSRDLANLRLVLRR